MLKAAVAHTDWREQKGKFDEYAVLELTIGAVIAFVLFGLPLAIAWLYIKSVIDR
jgi:hypothetical protein